MLDLRGAVLAGLPFTLHSSRAHIEFKMPSPSAIVPVMTIGALAINCNAPTPPFL